MNPKSILPPDPNPIKPRYVPLPDACDAHCHIFGPGDQFPYAPNRTYTPPDAGKEKLAALHRHLGLSRAVLEPHPRSGNGRFDDAIPFARALIEAAPDRVLWGTDFSHPNAKVMPNDGELVDLFAAFCTDEALRRKVLTTNPNRLYWPELM